MGEKPPNKLRSNENLQSKIKDGGSSDEHISDTSDRCKSINNLSRNASENSLNPRDDVLTIEERSVSAPIDGEKESVREMERDHRNGICVTIETVFDKSSIYSRYKNVDEYN